MHRWLWYGAGVYLSPSKITAALLMGLAVADIAYTAQTTLLSITPLAALGTTALVFKTAAASAYLLT
jgi:hypothetical protein